METFSLNVAIILLMIAECISSKDYHIRWTESMNRQLLNIFYGTYPPDEHHLERVKQAWDKRLPGYQRITAERLKIHSYQLKREYWNEWLSYPGIVREQMEETLANIYKDTDNGQPHHEKRILKMLLEIYPAYYKKFDIIRTVVYRWYERNTPLGKMIQARDVDWTPQRKADLLCIDEQVRREKKHITSKTKQRWLHMHKHLNVYEKSLVDYAYKLRKNYEYEPAMEEKLKAEEKYKILFDETQKQKLAQKGKRKSHQLPIPEGHQFKQEYQVEPFFPGYELTPEEWILFQQDMEEINTTFGDHAHHPPQNFYYGSSSHTPIDQGPFGSLHDVPHQQHHQWYPGESSHTPIQADRYGSLHDTPHKPFWNTSGNSSHTLIYQDQFSSLSDTLYPRRRQRKQGDSSSSSKHTPE